MQIVSLMAVRRAGVAVASAIVCAGLWSGCVGGDGNGNGNSNANGNSAQLPEFSGVFGQVVGAAGLPVEGATVAALGESAETDDDGYFELKLERSGEVVLQVSAAGYLNTTKRSEVGQEHPAAIRIHLLSEATGIALDATAGGMVEGMRGAALEAPANAFVGEAGDPVEGEVMVHLTPIDPSNMDELATYPGDLSATDASDQAVILESFGVLDVTVRLDGDKVQIADGKTVTIRIPAPAGGPTPPDTIALWSFDEEAGLWREEGTATLDTSTQTYVAEIAHMSYWNCDQPQSSTCISGKVVDRSGTPVPGAYLSAFGLDYNGSSDATTDENGNFRMLVRRDSQVSVEAIHPAGGGQIMTIASQDVVADVPLTAGADCQDVGTFEIMAGTVVTSGGGEIACSEVENPWLNTCAAGFGDLAQCFQPTGMCTIDISTGSMEYANGSRVETSLAGAASGNLMGTYYGPSGQRCGSYAFMVDTANPDAPSVGTYTLPGGNTLMMTVDPNTSEQTITCPSGETIVITAEQQQVYQACLGVDEGSTDQCEIEGLGGGFNECTLDSDCAGGSECCDFGSGLTLCLPAGSCPMP